MGDLQRMRFTVSRNKKGEKSVGPGRRSGRYPRYRYRYPREPLAGTVIQHPALNGLSLNTGIDPQRQTQEEEHFLHMAACFVVNLSKSNSMLISYFYIKKAAHGFIYDIVPGNDCS